MSASRERNGEGEEGGNVMLKRCPSENEEKAGTWARGLARRQRKNETGVIGSTGLVWRT